MKAIGVDHLRASDPIKLQQIRPSISLTKFSKLDTKYPFGHL